MARKTDLTAWVLEAIRALGGRASVVAVCREIWLRHEAELRMSGDLFYTWQYDVRWAAQRLRDAGELKKADEATGREWELA